jgi:hypothetical protein
MNKSDRQKLYDALMGNAPRKLRKILDGAVSRDVENLEPIVDEIIRRELELDRIWNEPR